MTSKSYGAVDLTKITSEERREEVMQKVQALQSRLGCKLQVTIYREGLHPEPELKTIVESLRLSDIRFKTGHGNETENYGVHVVADGVGEIPYALSILETFEAGKEPEKTFVPEHTLAAAALASATSRILPLNKLQEFIDGARSKGVINDEQYLLLYKHYLDQEELEDDQA